MASDETEMDYSNRSRIGRTPIADDPVGSPSVGEIASRKTREKASQPARAAAQGARFHAANASDRQRISRGSAALLFPSEPVPTQLFERVVGNRSGKSHRPGN